MIIRKARAGDIRSVRRIAERAYVKYIPRIGRPPAPMVADFKAHIERDDVMVVETDEQFAGFIVSYPDKDAYFIENVAVDPAFVGKGVGKALMDYAETAALKNGLSRLRLYTNVRMWENLGFYGCLGYSKTKIVREANFRRIYFEKELDNT